MIVAFFPKARTGGCTKEMSAYRDRYAEIQKFQGRVLAISMDDVDTLKSWRTELKAPQTFVADPDGRLVKLFDTKMPIISIGVSVVHVRSSEPVVKVLDVQEGGATPSTRVVR